VTLKKVTDIAWHEWDRSLAEPPQPPPDADTWSYISELPHSETAAKKLGVLWGVIPEKGAEAEFEKVGQPWERQFVLHRSTWNGSDFFLIRPGSFAHFIVSRAGREWFEKNGEGWLQFEPVRTD
jgi:hypothetical protein